MFNNVDPNVQCRSYKLRPTGSFNKRGIIFSWAGTTIHIKASLEVSGDAVTPEIANHIKSSIEAIWNCDTFGGYIATCQVNVQIKDFIYPDLTCVQVYCNKKTEEKHGDSHVHPGDEANWGDRYMCLRTEGANSILDNNGDRVIAHEFGHVLGLIDRYTEGPRPDGGRKRGVITVHPGWYNSLMGDNGRLGSDVIKELLYLYALEPGQSYTEEMYDTIRHFESQCRINIDNALLEAERKKYVSPPTPIQQLANYYQRIYNKLF